MGALFLLTAGGFSGFRVYRAFVAEKMRDEKYVITTLIQTGPIKEALPSIYLAELLQLSMDKPQNYFAFDEDLAEKALLNCPVIQKAKVKKIKPDSVHVDYEVFVPIALVGDSLNLAIDEQGVIFPIEPFFSPKRLPEIYFGSLDVDREKFELALAILSFFDKRAQFEGSVVKMIDVSNALQESFGKREVVITLVENDKTWYLRLTPHKFPEELNNFVNLRTLALAGSGHKKVVDLRLSKAAYIEEIRY